MSAIVLATLAALGAATGTPALGAAPGTPASGAAAEVRHELPVQHRGGPATASYVGRSDIALRDVGMAPGPRPGIQRCVWTVDMTIDRHVTGADGTVHARRSFRPGAVLSGYRPGDCMTTRAAIARDVSGQADKLRAQVILAAEEDHPQLRSDLDDARRLALAD